jgi:hypothetical protein
MLANGMGDGENPVHGGVGARLRGYLVSEN